MFANRKQEIESQPHEAAACYRTPCFFANADKIESFKGTISLPFEAGSAVAVKIIDDRGIESLRVLKV